MICLICWTLAPAANSAVREAHRFSPDQCAWCHISTEGRANPPGIRPGVSTACVRCHSDREDAFSHPLNIVPGISLPEEMPLENGRMACRTCHFAHPPKEKERPCNRALLRKPGRGTHFCSSCHGLRASDHCVFEFAHRASIRSMPQSGTLDSFSLQCIECHDRHATRVSRSTGGGRWQPFDSARSNHPVGISYAQVATRFPRAYTPAGTLPQQLRLYNDRIGCGTCHSAYSNAEFMLTVDNRGSRLCLSCHIK